MQSFRIISDEVKRRCFEAVAEADGLEVIIREPRRTNDQSAVFHALCNDAAEELTFYGRVLSPEQWKVLFVSGHAKATGLGTDIVCGLEGEYVNLRESTAKMHKKRMSSLIDYTTAYMVSNGVRLRARE